MFFLVGRDGALFHIEAGDELDAMREALRSDTDLHIEGDPPRIMLRGDMLAALGLDRPGLFDAYTAGWEPPTPAEFRELLKVAGLTGSPAAALVGVTQPKIRKWAGGDGCPSYAVWRLLTVYVGLSEPDVINKCLNN